MKRYTTEGSGACVIKEEKMRVLFCEFAEKLRYNNIELKFLASES